MGMHRQGCGSQKPFLPQGSREAPWSTAFELGLGQWVEIEERCWGDGMGGAAWLWVVL